MSRFAEVLDGLLRSKPGLRKPLDKLRVKGCNPVDLLFRMALVDEAYALRPLPDSRRDNLRGLLRRLGDAVEALRVLQSLGGSPIVSAESLRAEAERLDVFIRRWHLRKQSGGVSPVKIAIEQEAVLLEYVKEATKERYYFADVANLLWHYCSSVSNRDTRFSRDALKERFYDFKKKGREPQSLAEVVVGQVLKESELRDRTPSQSESGSRSPKK
jgi:hypothetical protein